MKKLNLCISVLICVLLIFVFSISSYAETLEDIHVIKIAPQDERAVIKTSERKLKIIKVGDMIKVQSSKFRVQSSGNQIQSSELKVIEIVKGRVVFEEETDSGIETVIIRLKNGKQTVERIKKTADKQPLLYAPQTIKNIK